MAGFTKKFVKRELIITLKSHNNNFPSVVFTLLRCVYGCLWPACACVRVCAYIYIYTKPRQQKFRAMNGAHLANEWGKIPVLTGPRLRFCGRFRNIEFTITITEYTLARTKLYPDLTWTGYSQHGLYLRLKRPRSDYTPLYYSLGQFILRGYIMA